MKAELNAHITTTSNQFEIINDQLHSIKIQNKVNAKTTNDQIECIEKTALEMNTKLQNKHETLFRKLQAIQEMIKMLQEKKQKTKEKENLQIERSPPTVINLIEETQVKQIDDTPIIISTDADKPDIANSKNAEKRIIRKKSNVVFREKNYLKSYTGHTQIGKNEKKNRYNRIEPN